MENLPNNIEVLRTGPIENLPREGKGLLSLLLLMVIHSVWANTTDQTTIFIGDNHLQPQWYSTDMAGNIYIHLYFFWSKRCPHCRSALPLIPKLMKNYPWLKLHSFELSDNQRNVWLYFRMIETLKHPSNRVPGFVFCEQMMTGYRNEQTTGTQLKKRLEACYQRQIPTKWSDSLILIVVKMLWKYNFQNFLLKKLR